MWFSYFSFQNRPTVTRPVASVRKGTLEGKVWVASLAGDSLFWSQHSDGVGLHATTGFSHLRTTSSGHRSQGIYIFPSPRLRSQQQPWDLGEFWSRLGTQNQGRMREQRGHTSLKSVFLASNLFLTQPQTKKKKKKWLETHTGRKFHRSQKAMQLTGTSGQHQFLPHSRCNQRAAQVLAKLQTNLGKNWNPLGQLTKGEATR